MIIVPTEKKLDFSNAPIMLLGIVVINVLVFLLYQSGDSQKAMESITGFVESGYVEKESPIFERYLEKEDRSDELELLQQAQRQEDWFTIAQMMLIDLGYYQHITRAARSEFDYELYDEWRDKRPEFQETFQSISSFAYGLRSTDVSIITLLSHQFLHGGFGHIFGNMVFLLLFGFAVEAAIGHIRFLLFYLVGGIFAGLAQVATNLGSDVPLVGASGAISGVMAMYLAVFRLKRIEFFYWVFFFVGYFRAPALLILPLYIGKEMYQYFYVEGSNVAYMAHAGGFAAGAILIGIAMLFSKKTVNKDYIEEDQKVSARDKTLADIYRAIENLRFDYAIKLLVGFAAKEGMDFQLAKIRYNLEKIQRGKNFIPSFRALMTQKNLSQQDINQLNDLWLEEPNSNKLLPLADQLQLAFQFTTLDNLKGAANIADFLNQQGFQPKDLLLLAQRLATRFGQKNDHGNSTKYQQVIQQLTKDGHHGVM